MFRTQSVSIFRSNFLQTVVAATGVCYRYGVANNPYTGFIHPVLITHTSGCHYSL